MWLCRTFHRYFVALEESKAHLEVLGLPAEAAQRVLVERVEALRSQIEQAEIKRDIVGSNYPSYRETGAQIRRSYDGVKEQSAAISLALRRFNYTYDTADLTRAIQLSYELNSDIARYTNRMILYRQLVESGVPERSHAAERLAAPASVLPLP